MLVLFCLIGVFALLSVLAFTSCRIHAELWLELAGGCIAVHIRYLVPVYTFRFRISLFSAPYLAIDLLKHNGAVSPVYRAFQKKEEANPWADAVWNAIRWKSARACLYAGTERAPALSAMSWGALAELIRFLLSRYITPNTAVAGVPDAGSVPFRLKVEGIATLSLAQIIRERFCRSKEKE